jgi:hypothetical protein
MRRSGISSAAVISDKSLTAFLIFVAIFDDTLPLQADVIHDSAIQSSVAERPERAFELKLLSLQQHRG